MKKKIVLRSMLGFPLGLALGYLITILISLIYADGSYSPCMPELAVIMGNEINAVLLQALLCGILGSGFGACSVIWEIETWGDRETDWNLLFNYFRTHAADGLCFVLDGTQPARYFKLFWHFSFNICRSVARTIYGRHAQCQKTERNIDQKAGCRQGIARGSPAILTIPGYHCIMKNA